jgi:hypothetical protein
MFGRKKSQSPESQSHRSPEDAMDREIKYILSESPNLHPLDIAARFTALFSTQNYDKDHVDFIKIIDINCPTVCDMMRSDENEVGLSFDFFGSAGETGLIYLTSSFGLIAPKGKDTGPRIPVDLISRFVPNYEEAIRKLVRERSYQKSPEESKKEEFIRSKLKEFLG